MEKDLVELSHEGIKKLCNHPERDLSPRDAQRLIQSFNLKGSSEITGIVTTAYVIGYEQGYRDAQENK